MNPCLSATEISEFIDKEIEKLTIPGHPARLYNPIRYILDLGGKRLRPLLALMSYNMFSDDFNNVIKPTLSIELFHNFSLIHDDIMDKAPMRRGKDTVHKKWDDNVAILSGDAMLVKAYELLEGASMDSLPSILKTFNKTAIEVCEGQQLDMDFEARPLDSNMVTEAEYMNMIRLKTAVLFGFSLKLGGILGSANETQLQQLYDAGVHLGLAFQLQDDLLDLYGGEKFGKQVGGDILNAKKTYLLVKAFELSSKEDHQKIITIMNREGTADEDKINTMKKLYDHYQIESLVQAEIESHLKNFKNTINTINTSRASNILFFVSSLTHRSV